jgi:hypothetical protein
MLVPKDDNTTFLRNVGIYRYVPHNDVSVNDVSVNDVSVNVSVNDVSVNDGPHI